MTDPQTTDQRGYPNCFIAEELAAVHPKCEVYKAPDVDRYVQRLMDAHSGCGCDPNCWVCREKGYT